MVVERLRFDDVVHDVPATGGTRTLLHGVSCEFARGTVTRITGANGAGKSTMIHLLAGIVRPTSGTVFSDDEPISRWRAGHRDWWRRQVGVAFQQPYLIDDLSTVENVVLPLIPRGLSIADLESRGIEALRAVGLDGKAREAVRHFSGGEKQRLSVARALIHGPDILLLDEPTAHQDDDGVSLIADAVSEVRERTLIVLVSHDRRLSEATRAERVFEIDAGRLLEVAT